MLTIWGISHLGPRPAAYLEDGSLVKPRLMLDLLARRHVCTGTDAPDEFAQLQSHVAGSGAEVEKVTVEEVNAEAPEAAALTDEWCAVFRDALRKCEWSALVAPSEQSSTALRTMASQIDTNAFDCLSVAADGASIGLGVTATALDPVGWSLLLPFSRCSFRCRRGSFCCRRGSFRCRRYRRGCDCP